MATSLLAERTVADFSLTEEEAAQWDRDGFIIRRDVFDAAENQALNAAAEAMVDGKWPVSPTHVDRNALVKSGAVEDPGGIAGMHKIHLPNAYHPEFMNRARDPRLVDPVAGILGPDIFSINNLYIFKAPKIGMGFPWHQDKFYFRNKWHLADTSVGTWTACEDARVDNGCLWVVPGSHQDDIYVHDELDGPQQGEFKKARDVDEAKAIPVEIDAGSVLYFHSHLLHKSTDNASSRFRRSYVVHYISAQTTYVHPVEADGMPVPGQRGMPTQLVRGRTYAGCVQPVVFDLWPADRSY